LAAAPLLGIALPASAADWLWENAAGGLWQGAANWNGGVVPGSNDRARFELGDSGYTVTFNNSVSDVGILIRTDVVTFDMSGFTFTTSDVSPFRMADVSGNIARLTLTNGTLDTSPSASSLLAGNASAQATMTITTGGVWNAGTSNIDVGNAGAGTLSIVNGGRLSGTDMNIASLAGSTGSLSISGATSSITLTNVMQVGRTGQGSLTISSGASVSTNMNLGSLVGGIGAVTVTGLGSNLTTAAGSPAGLVIGSSGSGTMTVSNGANLSSVSLAIAQSTDTTGSLIVTDANTNWANSGAITLGLGARSSASVSILNGAQASTASAVLADGSSSVATVSVAGRNSFLSITAGPTVGNRGSGHLTISDGATVAVTSNGSTIIASQAGSSGDVNVSGAGSSLRVAVGTTVGSGGAGVLSVLDGALVTSHDFLLASSAGSSALVTVSGPGSRLVAGGSNSMNMGSGDATVTVEDGGAVSLFEAIQLGTNVGTRGTLRVAGPGSSLSSTFGTLRVGNAG
jgi:T5SS/PEP-CTERM-associated repeat protein